MCDVSQNEDCLWFPTVLLLANPWDERSWWTEPLSVLRRERWRSCGWFLTAAGSSLLLAGLSGFTDPSRCRRAPEITTVSSRTLGLNKVISVQRVSKCYEKNMHEQMEEFICSISFWWILGALLPMVCLFYILSHFFPNIKLNIWKLVLTKLTKKLLH